MAELIEVSRYVVMVTTNLSAFYVLLCCTLKKKRSAKVAVIYYILKTLIVNIGMNQVYAEEIVEEPLWKNMYLVVAAFSAVATYAVPCYTFQGGFAKVALVSILCEAAASLMGIGLIILANVLAGRAELLSFTGKIQWQDGVIPAGMCLLCILIYKLCGKRLKQFRDYELKHKKLWLFLSWLWVGSGFATMLPEYNKKLGMTVIVIMIGGTIFGAVVIILGILLWQSWRRQVMQKHNYLIKQRKLMFLYSKALWRQIEQMERQQKEIDEQMEKLSEMEDLSERNRTASEYLQKLKARYETIRAGVYIDDYQMDSILYSYAGIFEKLGVTPEFSFGAYRKGCLREEDAAVILLDLLEAAVQEIRKAAHKNRFLRLQGGTVKNQAVFRMECAHGGGKLWRPGKIRISERMGMLKRRVRKLGGRIKVSRNGECVLAEVLMDGR